MSDLFALLDWEPFRACLAEMRTQQDGFEKYLEESFDELSDLRSDLERFYQDLQLQQLELERNRIDLEMAHRMAREELESQQAEKLAAIEAQYRTAQAELSSLRDRQIGDGGLQDESLQLRIKELERERTKLQRELEHAEARAEELAVSAKELSNLGNDTSEIESELEATRAQLQAARQDNGGDDGLVSDLKQERDDLEMELEQVRNRASELSEAMDEMKRQSIEERAEWSSELKQMRKVLEQQSQLLTAGPMMAAVPAQPDSPSELTFNRPAENQGEDPVLGSVMAQFNRLRQERADRRALRDDE